MKIRVETILSAKHLNQPIDPTTAQWISNLEDDLADKLAATGLIEPRRRDKALLAPFITDFSERRIDVKKATKIVWGQVQQNLTAFFGADRDMGTIKENDAEDFKMHLIEQKLAPTTVHKRLQFARMFFKSAVKRKLILSNPFAEVTANATIADDRKRYVTREETERILVVCDPTWRLIVALSRYAGLRCPSEVLSLRWNDINWQTNRITVQSPKTEHHAGKASRVIPLFPELVPIMLDAQELAPDGSVYVVGGNYRQASFSGELWKNCNLRTQFMRLLQRAGLEPWPRLFHAMRASRETELATYRHSVNSFDGKRGEVR